MVRREARGWDEDMGYGMGGEVDKKDIGVTTEVSSDSGSIRRDGIAGAPGEDMSS